MKRKNRNVINRDPLTVAWVMGQLSPLCHMDRGKFRVAHYLSAQIANAVLSFCGRIFKIGQHLIKLQVTKLGG